jgi:hypothetical protein
MAEWLKDFLSKFPGWKLLLNEQPALQELIGNWYKDVQDTDKQDYATLYQNLMGVVESSEWWQTNAEPIRDFHLFKAKDPASFAEQMKINNGDAQQTAFSLGGWDNSSFYGLQGSQYRDYMGHLAKEKELNGWSAEQLASRISRDAMQLENTPQSGKIFDTMESIEAYARAMVVNMPKAKIREFAHRVNSVGGMFGDDDPTTFHKDESKKMMFSTMSMEDVKSFINGLAETKFGKVTDVNGLVARGLTVSDSLQDFTGEISKFLELDPHRIDLSGFKWDDLVKGTDPDGLRFANAQDGETFAKRQSMYQMSDDFRGSVRSLSGAVAQMFGNR